ncbi:MAG: glycosyltransferase family 2 protein [Candidatus Dadabacteria bacterium]|nr:glycosyltransferase family 2 protein [Candidatus Dadabacteria bacterium]MYE60836.1 glycosyltransferase family 2 protein [Candidatus Dadabacteria bacterium]MYI72760.1 glycosyltransferase family 2 protein [Candidatus Dadabacteria bacterium]
MEKTVVIIPALNEERSIGQVIGDIPRDLVTETVVVNNGSTDSTASVASGCGATVIDEERRGYGQACLAGIDYIKSSSYPPDIIVFLDGDYSDYPGEMKNLVSPIIEDGYDLVIGSRTIGERQKGALLPQALVGNYVATRLIKLFYGVSFTDLGPFRAVRYDKLLSLGMRDRTFGWTVEMQVKAAKKGLRCTEIPVSYRKRIGTSKVTGTITGSFMAGVKIIWMIFRQLLS